MLAAPAAGSESAGAEPDGGRPTMIDRAHELVETLHNSCIGEGWDFDEQRAAEFVDSVRQVCVGESDNGTMRTIDRWLRDHGQSLGVGHHPPSVRGGIVRSTDCAEPMTVMDAKAAHSEVS